MNPFDQKSGTFKLPENPGMFELAKKDTCLDPSHSMPTHIYIPPGHGYKHVCPRCGHVSVATNTLTY